MRGTVLRGDYTRLRRRGDRVWIRFRPYELFWHTSHAFSVEEVRSLETDALRFERRRRRLVAGLGPGRTAQSAITRVTFGYGDGNRASVDLFETEATIVAAFQDVIDRLVDDEEHRPQVVVDDAPHARAEPVGLSPIFWRADPEAEPGIDPRREQHALWEQDPLTPELTRDVSFNLDLGADPHAVGQWVLRRLREDREGERLADSADDWLVDLTEPPVAGRASGEVVWVRKRRRRLHRVRRRLS